MTGATCGTGNAHSFRKPDFTPFGEFMILLIRCTYTLCITEFVSLMTICVADIQEEDSKEQLWITVKSFIQ